MRQDRCTVRRDASFRLQLKSTRSMPAVSWLSPTLALAIPQLCRALNGQKTGNCDILWHQFPNPPDAGHVAPT
jgi:hypothetical protein